MYFWMVYLNKKRVCRSLLFSLLKCSLSRFIKGILFMFLKCVLDHCFHCLFYSYQKAPRSIPDLCCSCCLFFKRASCLWLWDSGMTGCSDAVSYTQNQSNTKCVSKSHVIKMLKVDENKKKYRRKDGEMHISSEKYKSITSEIWVLFFIKQIMTYSDNTKIRNVQIEYIVYQITLSIRWLDLSKMIIFYLPSSCEYWSHI